MQVGAPIVPFESHKGEATCLRGVCRPGERSRLSGVAGKRIASFSLPGNKKGAVPEHSSRICRCAVRESRRYSLLMSSSKTTVMRSAAALAARTTSSPSFT